MNTSSHNRTVRVGLRNGLHMRPVGILSQCANGFQSEIRLTHNGTTASAKGTPMELLPLAVPHNGEVLIEADGPDAFAAVEELARLFAENFGISEDDSPTSF